MLWTPQKGCEETISIKQSHIDEKRVNNLFIKLILVRIQYQYAILYFGNNIV